QRVMDCGEDRHILLSKRVAEDLGHSREWGPYLHDLGECAVKHGVPVFLVNFYGDGVGNPELPKIVRQSQSERVAKAAAGHAKRKIRGTYWAIAATIFLLAAAALGILSFSRQNSATVLPEEKIIAVKPTRNPDAYVFYLRANQISRNPDTLLEDYKTAEQLYMQAIELDPNFALAHARLASVCAEVFRYYEPTDSWRTKARAEAEAALRLQPNLAEGHFALGQSIYWMDQDYDRALEQFEIASRLSPSNADTRRLIAAIERRQGKWPEALETYEQVAKLDPQNPSTARELMYTNTS